MKITTGYNMTEKEDFLGYGKETPYAVLDGFFDTIAEKTLLLAKQKEPFRAKNRMLWQTIAAAASLAALFFIGYQTEFRHDAIESQLIAQDSQLQTNSKAAKEIEISNQINAIKQSKHEIAKVPLAKPAGTAITEAVSDVLADFTDEELQQMAALYKSDPMIGEIEQ